MLINSAKPTDSETKTEFPDFISNNGFIEHFRVTSGKSTRKGYDIATKESKMQKEHESFMANMTLTSPNCLSTSFCREDDSIDNFHKSFKMCWEYHINHLYKYNGKKHLSCFLISSDDVFRVYECPYDNNNICYGDLARRDEQMKFCLSYDSYLLDYIYEYKKDIDYVIYFNKNQEYVEIIKISNIPFIKKYLSKHTYKLHAPETVENSTTYSICRISK